MNAAYLHLILNHVPVVGFFLILPLNILALFSSERTIRLIAAGATVVLSLSAVPVFISGQQAESIVMNLQEINKSTIADHEDIAAKGFISSLATGAVAALILVSLRKKIWGKHLKKLQALLLGLNLLTSILLGITAKHGGFFFHSMIINLSYVAVPVCQIWFSFCERRSVK